MGSFRSCSVSYIYELRQQHSVAATCLANCNHTNSGSNTVWLQHAQQTILHQLRQQHCVAATCSPTILHQLRQQHCVAATCSTNYTTPTQAATLCGCNMLNQLYYTNSGSNTLWLQHAQSTIEQHATLNSGSKLCAWLQHAQPTIPHHLRATLCGRNMLNQWTQAATLCGCNMLSELYHNTFPTYLVFVGY